MPRTSSPSVLALVIALPSMLAADFARAETAPDLAAVVVAGPELATTRAADLASAVRAAVQSHARLAVIAADDEAFLFRGPKPRVRSKKELAAARKALDDASNAFAALDFANAVKLVNKAGAVLQPMIGLRVAADLDKERVELAVALAHAQRDEARLEQLLREFSIRFPGETVTSSRWPPDIVNRQKLLIRASSSVLSVRTTPPGMVFVDGREIGRSPVRLGALPVGAHRIEVDAPGHYSAEQWVDTVEDQEAIVELRLAPNLSSRLEKLSIGEEAGPELEAAMKEAAPTVKVLVFAWVDGRDVVLKRVDLASGVPEGATQSSRASNGESGIALAVTSLFEGTGGSSAGGVPLWAWLGGGAGVAAVGVGVTLRILASSTGNRFDERIGALTQREAYDLRARANWQSRGGGVLMGLGLATIAGVVGVWVFDLTPSG